MPTRNYGSSAIVAQGQKTVGDTSGGGGAGAPVALVSVPTPCSKVWIGAPTASHTKGGTNTGNILIGNAATHTLMKSGAMCLKNSDYAGITLLVTDASTIKLAGFNADDAVEYMIFA